MKGHTKIELVDIESGTIETFEDENEFTEALDYIYNRNFGGLSYDLDTTRTSQYSQPERLFFPIYKRTIAGILLFNQQNSKENGVFAPSSNRIIGYAASDVNATEDSKRGSFNSHESGPVTNGYRYVWDFTTAQANGTISSVSLTNELGGKSYFGSLFNEISTITKITSLENTPEGDVFNKYTHLVEGDVENNRIITITPENGKVIVRKYWEPLSKISIMDSLGCENHLPLETIELNVSTFLPPSGSFDYTFLDGKNGYWYGFSLQTISNNQSFKQIKINKSDYSFTERTINLQGIKVGTPNIRYITNTRTQINSTVSNLVIRGGYYYASNSYNDKIFKMNLEDDSDWSYVGENLTKNEIGKGMIVVGDYILGQYFLIDSNDQVSLHKRNSSEFRFASYIH